ncbi:MAG: hypothetical protein IE927_04830 [Rhodobacterales bacterium]|nr:hypothetical protein [Rhodobacterales bacterium]
MLKQADTEMAGPENRRRLATIAHLKAAVAATVADLKNPPAHPAEAPMDRYRLDLARIVRPARPVAERTNPLVLVSQQRIDAPAAPPPAEAGPIRPRRVASGNLALVEPDDDEDGNEDPNLFTPAMGFADFARTTGATELPDLLEAAAAYVAAVEGRDSFTRPHLMRHVAAFRPDLAREDSLRAFGTLMRDGLILKSRRGQFKIAAQSRYLAAVRKLPR